MTLDEQLAINRLENLHLSPTEKRLMEILKDQKPHKTTDLISCLMDDLGGKSNVAYHITFIRRKLHPIGWSIMSVTDYKVSCYQLVRLVGCFDHTN